MPLTDITIPNPVDPFRPDPSSENDYSIKLIRSRRFGTDLITVYTGRLSTDLEASAVGIQSALLTALESLIQLTIDEDFRAPAPPILSRPTTIVLTSNDILVAWTNRSDYFIINGTGVTRKVIFVSDEIAVDTDIITDTLPFTKTYYSTGNTVSYDLIFQSNGDFTIAGSAGNGTVTYTYSSATGTFRGNALIRIQDPDTGVVVLKGQYYTEVGITVYPNAPDPETLGTFDTASGTQGVIYDPVSTLTTPVSALDLYNYMVTYYAGPHGTRIQCLIRKLFPLLTGSIRHVLASLAQESYAVRTGYTCMIEASCGNVVEVRLT